MAALGRTAANTDRRPAIALCLIVRNEAESLPRCLGSVQGLIDDLVVVDTGSTDDTIAIARRFGARVFHFLWTSDFSAARNFSIAQTEADWILYLDADEELLLESPDALRRTIAGPVERPRCYLVVKLNLDDTQPDGIGPIFYEGRLFTNHPRVRFVRPIHEQLRHLDGLNLLDYVKAPGISIRHYGYLSDRQAAKSERDLPIIEAALAQDPDDPDNHFYLGRERYRQGRFDLAIGPLRRAIDLAQAGPRRTYLHLAYGLLSGAYLRIRRPREAVRAAQEGVAVAPHPDVWLSLGFGEEMLGRLREAAICFERALAGSGHDDSQLILGSPASSTWAPLRALGSVYERLGDRARAHEYYRRALEHLPSDPDLRAKLEATRPRVQLGPASDLTPTGPHLVPPPPVGEGARGRGPLPTVALCMIVRNEAENLPRCLGSVRGLVDDLVVVDTGSTDDTIAVARQHGARVFQYDWTDDFAAARNFSLDQATADWIFYLDADEALDPKTAPALRRLIARPTARPCCYLVQIRNHVDRDGEPDVTYHPAGRLFTNHPQVRFVRALHEEVVRLDDLELLERVATDELVIDHWGYLTAARARKGRGERDLAQLEAAAAAEPASGLNQFYLGREYLLLGDLDRAVTHLEAACRLGGNDARQDYHPLAHAYLAGIYLDLGRPADAARVARDGAAKHDHPEIACNLGMALGALGRYEEAISWLERARRFAGQLVTAPASVAASSWRPLEGLGHAYAELGQADRAYDCYRQALDLRPDRTDIQRRAAGLAIGLKRWDDAVRHLRQVLDAEPAAEDLPPVLAQCLAAAGRLQEAHDVLIAALAAHPEQTPLRVQLADLLLAAGEPQAALDVLTPALGGEPREPIVYQKLGAALRALGRYAEAAQALHTAIDLKKKR